MRAVGESACRPGLDPGSVRPAATCCEPVVTCGYTLGTSRRLAADDETMCPKCARSGLSMARGRERQLRRSFQAWGQPAASLVRAGLLIVWLQLNVSGFRFVLARGWHGARLSMQTTGAVVGHGSFAQVPRTDRANRGRPTTGRFAALWCRTPIA